MIDTNFKIASYLDEAGDTPPIACQTLALHEISYVVLRYSWGGANICTSPNSEYSKLKKLLLDNNISTISICSELGDVPITDLMKISESEINHAFNIASYFDAESINIKIGNRTKNESATIIDEWMAKISEISIKNNIIPLLELKHDSLIKEPTMALEFLNRHTRWKFLYDPVQLILKNKINPFIKYWPLMKHKTIAIDVRDYMVGKCFKPPGLGDAKIAEVLYDAKNSNYTGWLFLEPALGKQYSSAKSKRETFKLAIDGLQYII